jgi:hypothetical protein
MPYRTPITSLIIVLQVRTQFPPDVRGGREQVYHVLIFPTLWEYALIFQPSNPQPGTYEPGPTGRRVQGSRHGSRWPLDFSPLTPGLCEQP